jgi:hypothetical protein
MPFPPTVSVGPESAIELGDPEAFGQYFGDACATPTPSQSMYTPVSTQRTFDKGTLCWNPELRPRYGGTYTGMSLILDGDLPTVSNYDRSHVLWYSQWYKCDSLR